MTSLKYINLGCGTHFHKDWVNLDFVKTGENVIAHNLNLGIPFGDDSYEVVYHSHVLEHFQKDKADFFIKECHRVLKDDGIIRIAVPDLEQIINEYQTQLKLAIQGDEKSELNYNWIMLELFDQTVRNHSGGQMAEYLFQEELKNEDYVFYRIGSEAKNLRNSYFANKAVKLKAWSSLKQKLKSALKWAQKKLVNKKFKLVEQHLKIGRFRQSGEIHQWMYDRYSLSLLLKQNGFRKIAVKTAFESDIPEFSKFNLDVINGEIRKPDSLFVEAYK